MEPLLGTTGCRSSGQYEAASGKDLYGPEASNLQTNGLFCNKNPGHTGFIPIRELSRDHLPPEYQNDENILEVIKGRADLTVHVKAKAVSMERPEHFPFAEKRGGILQRGGTGWCRYVYRGGVFTEAGPKSYEEFIQSKPICPCVPCMTSDQPQTTWYEIHVVTAAHVICDDVEAKGAEIRIFYDDTESVPVIATGLRVIKELTHLEEDRCEMLCVLHDNETALRLMETRRYCWQLRQTLDEACERKLKVPGESEPIIIISHPHGSTKHVSIGYAMGYDVKSNTVIYDTPTCPGSSGSHVAWWLDGWYLLPHSRSLAPCLNQSGCLNKKFCSNTMPCRFKDGKEAWWVDGWYQFTVI